MNSTRDRSRYVVFLIAGAIAGMIGGAMMAMFTMIATATYLHMGFFTPLYVIASPLTGPQTMMTAMHAGTFYFAVGTALLGLIVHMMWSASYRLRGWSTNIGTWTCRPTPLVLTSGKELSQLLLSRISQLGLHSNFSALFVFCSERGGFSLL